MTQTECIEILKQAETHIREKYEVRSMSLFGSTARGTNTKESDIDLLVDMPPKALMLVRLENYLENLLGRSVDLVLQKKNLRPFLLNEIQRDGITIF